MRSGDYNLEIDQSGKRRLQMYASMQAALAWSLSPSGFECICHISSMDILKAFSLNL